MTKRISGWIVALLLAAAPAIAAAQTTTPSPNAGRRVEIEGYGSIGNLLSAGEATLSLPSAGAPITTSSPLFPSRRVSSWFFGDGAALLNDVSAQLGLSARITPLDAAIASLGRLGKADNGMGGRLRVRTAAHVWTELAIDITGITTGVPDDLLNTALETRASYIEAMTALFASGPFSGTNVTATASFPKARWRDVTTTLSANVELDRVAGITPSITLGAGMVTRTGAEPEMSLEGRYRTKILGVVPIDETDRVTVRSVANAAPVVVIGGALTRTLADRLSFRLDARMLATNRTIATNVDASPLVASGTPADFIESFTNPSIQFSNNASTGRRSSLSGDTFDHLEVARSTRLQARVVVTFGIALRF